LPKQNTEIGSSSEPCSWSEILPYFLGPVIFLIAILSDIYFNNFLLMIWIPFVVLPIVDYLMPIDHTNVTSDRVRLMDRDKRFLIPLYTIWIMDFSILYWLMYRVSTGNIGNSFGQFFMYAYCAAQPGSFNAVVGHELLHRKNIIHKVLGTFSYSKLFYSHYFIQHVRGHHKNVATPGDSSTAIYGESVYEFY
jgi:alkane 1-monooxygenase